MLSLGGFFLALVLGDVILGWDQSQPVGMTLQTVIGWNVRRTLAYLFFNCWNCQQKPKCDVFLFPSQPV